MRWFLLVLPFALAAILEFLAFLLLFRTSQLTDLSFGFCLFFAAIYPVVFTAVCFGLGVAWQLVTGERSKSLKVTEHQLPSGLFGERRTNYAFHHQAAQDGIETSYDDIKHTWDGFAIWGFFASSVRFGLGMLYAFSA